jgi:hypothetical protein
VTVAGCVGDGWARVTTGFGATAARVLPAVGRAALVRRAVGEDDAGPVVGVGWAVGEPDVGVSLGVVWVSTETIPAGAALALLWPTP